MRVEGFVPRHVKLNGSFYGYCWKVIQPKPAAVIAKVTRAKSIPSFLKMNISNGRN